MPVVEVIDRVDKEQIMSRSSPSVPARCCRKHLGEQRFITAAMQ
jgi:hypothetical protein